MSKKKQSYDWEDIIAKVVGGIGGIFLLFMIAQCTTDFSNSDRHSSVQSNQALE